MSRNKPPFAEAMVVGVSLFWLPEKVEGNEVLKPANRVLAHIIWPEDGHVHEGTVPVMHPYPPGQEEMLLKTALRRYPFGSVLTPEDTSGAVHARLPEKASTRALVDGQIVGWFARYLPRTRPASTPPVFHPFLVVRRRSGNDIRTVHVRLEQDNAVWACQPGRTLLEELGDVQAFLTWANEPMAGVWAAQGQGGYYQAVPATGEPEPAPYRFPHLAVGDAPESEEEELQQHV